MAQTNTKRRAAATFTHEGARAFKEAPIQALTRVLNAHMLWEDTFYLDGMSAAKALEEAVVLAMRADPLKAGMAILDAREVHNIRHASLKAAVVYAERGGPDARDLIFNVIQRADELAEVLAMAGGKKAPHAVMKGVRDAFGKFDEYQFGKYKGEGRAVTLRDAVFLTHPNPGKVPLVQKIVDGTLEVPNTWETRLSAGEDKKAVFEDLLRENKLGAMALLRNLRNMDEAGVELSLIKFAMAGANWSRVLPFRFLTAALTAPRFQALLDDAFEQAVAGSDPLPGRTAVLVDHSGSMETPVSAKSIIKAWQAGNALAAAVRGDVDLFFWGTTAKQARNWQRLSVALQSYDGSVGYGTNIVPALNLAHQTAKYDRLIVVTDMQFSDTQVGGLRPGQRGYTINLGPYGNPGLLHGDWTHLTGFSTATLRYIAQAEQGL